MSKETKIKVINAFRAMKAIGIKLEKVKPVLKTLLKLCDKNWALIEAENYRVLADAISERDQSQHLEEEEPDKLNSPQLMEELSQKSHEKTVLAAASQSLALSKGKQPSTSKLISYRMKLRDGDRDRGRGNAPLSMNKKKKTATRALTKPSSELPADATHGGYTSESPALGSVSERNTADGSMVLYESRNNGNLSVKISLSYNVAPDFHIPSLEDKFIRLPKKLEVFSMKDLSKEMCECFMEFGIDSKMQSVINDATAQDFDISKGQEIVSITVVNEVNDEHPPSFCYIRQNAVFQNAYANFCVARIADSNCCATCCGDCLSLSTPCACSYETGGEFAYTKDGLVNEELLEECISMNRDPNKHCQVFCKDCPLERSTRGGIIGPCKGHVVRKFINECWIKCGCDIQCGNRVVQRGISRKLQVFMTRGGKGWGLRTLEELPKGAFVCEYVGEVLTNAELSERVSRSPVGEKHSYPLLLDADWCVEGVLKDEEALCLDATHYGNVARFINHKCYDSNLVEIPVEVETPDHHYYHLAFFTSRKVKAMEELTWDYGIDFGDVEHPIKAFRCQCGSKFCRDIKRSRCRAGR